MLVKNKNNKKVPDFDYPFWGIVIFICIFSVVIIFFIYENVKVFSSAKNVILNRIWNYFEKRSATTRAYNSPFSDDDDSRPTTAGLEIDLMPMIYQVVLSYELSGEENCPQLLIEGVNNFGRGRVMKLLIQIGKRLSKKYDPSSSSLPETALVPTTATVTNVADANASNISTITSTKSGDDSFYSLIDIELKAETFNSPVPIKNFPLLIPNHFYDLRILLAGDSKKFHDDFKSILEGEGEGESEGGGRNEKRLVYNKILFEGKVRLEINLFNFKPLMILKDAILLYDRLKPSTELSKRREEKEEEEREKETKRGEKEKEMYVTYPDSIFENDHYIASFPKLKPISFLPRRKPLQLVEKCKFLSQIRVYESNTSPLYNLSTNNSSSSSPSSSSFSSSYYIEYDEKNASEGKISILQNPNNELEYFVLLLKIDKKDEKFPRGWALSYNSEHNGAIYEQTYSLETISKSGHEKEILIANETLSDILKRIGKNSPSPLNNNDENEHNFKVNNIALDHCIGIARDSMTPEVFSVSPPPTKAWFEQSPFLGVSLNAGELTYVSHFINSDTCHKSLFSGSFSPDDSSFFFLNKKRGKPISFHAVNRHYCKTNTENSDGVNFNVHVDSDDGGGGDDGVDGKDATLTSTIPDLLDIKALISNTLNQMPLLSLPASENLSPREVFTEIAPFPFFTPSVTHPMSVNFQSAKGISVTQNFFHLPPIRYRRLNERGQLPKYVFNVRYPPFEYTHAVSPSHASRSVTTVTREFFLNGQTRAIWKKKLKCDVSHGIRFGVSAGSSSHHSNWEDRKKSPSYLYVVWWVEPFTASVARKLMGKQTNVRFEDVAAGSFFNSNYGAAYVTDRWAIYSSSVFKLTNERQFLNVEFLNGPMVGQKARAYHVLTLVPVFRTGNLYFYSFQDTKMKNPSYCSCTDFSKTASLTSTTTTPTPTPTPRSNIETEDGVEFVRYVIAVFQRQKSEKNLLVLVDSFEVKLFQYCVFNGVGSDKIFPPSGYVGPLKPEELYCLKLNSYIADEKLLEYSSTMNFAILLMSFAEYLHYIQCIDKDDVQRVFNYCIKRRFYPKFLCYLPRYQYDKYVDLVTYKY